MPTILMVVAPKDFRDEELFEPKEVFEAHGYTVKIASEKAETARGTLGAEAAVDTDLHDVDTADLVAVVFVGGAGAEKYFTNAKAMRLVKEATEQGKVVAAICVAPAILANAGILKGKRATSWPGEKKRLVAKGAKFIEQDIVTDGNIITACGPHAARAFGEAVVKALGKSAEKPERERHLEGEGRQRRKRHGRY